jgi:DNA-binding LacI/PurR family transcriptional regulator
VVGFDDIQVASLVHPSLTTVRQDKAGMGTAAANAGMDLIENPDASPQPITLPVELVVRDSA